MKAFGIPESATFAGDWWAPSQLGTSQEQEAPGISGVLTWEEQRATLELHNALTPLRGTIHEDDERLYPAIHGTTTESQFITVLDAQRFGGPVTFGPAGMRETERVRSSWVVVGGHVNAQSLYTEIEARIPGLPMWLGRTGAKQTLSDKSEESPSVVMCEFAVLPEEAFEIPCLPGIIAFGIGRGFSGNLDSAFSVTTSGYLRIRPTEPQRLSWLIDQLWRATTLLAVLSGSPMAPDGISIKLALDNRSCELLVALREAKYCVHEKAREFFMIRPHMQVGLGALFSKWFGLYDSVAMPSQLALSVLYSANLWSHVEFLSLMQALEGLHRATMPGVYLSKDDYEPIRKVLCDSIPQSVSTDHRKALKSRLQYGHEFSLHKRLGELVGRLAQDIRKHILGPDGSLPRSWINTRNYYTHWDETERGSVLDGIEMHRACVRMKHLLRVLYLDLVGIPHQAILQPLHNPWCKESRYLIQLNNMEHRKQNPDSTTGALMRIDVKDSTEGS